MSWSDKAKLKVLEYARKDLIEHASWYGYGPSIECLDSIIDEISERLNENTKRKG